jgi:chromatin remodeling complex protein RSC6
MSSSTTTAKKTAPKAAKAAAPAPAAAAAPVVAAAPAPVVAAPAPVVAAPIANTVSTTTATESEDVNIVAQFNTLVEQVNAARTALTTLFSGMKKLEKQIPRELKKAQKGRRRRAAETTATGEPIVKKPSVFTIPTQISDALATFLGLAKGTQISRSEVTTRVCKYAKDHNLMDKQNIKPDAALRKLLGVKESDQLRILNLQKYLSDHYPLSVKAKADKAAAAAAAPARA